MANEERVGSPEAALAALEMAKKGFLGKYQDDLRQGPGKNWDAQGSAVKEAILKILGLPDSMRIDLKAFQKGSILGLGSKPSFRFFDFATVNDFDGNGNKGEVEYAEILFEDLAELYKNNFTFQTLLELNRTPKGEVEASAVLAQLVEFFKSPELDVEDPESLRARLFQNISSESLEGGKGAIYVSAAYKDTDTEDKDQFYLFEDFKMTRLEKKNENQNILMIAKWRGRRDGKSRFVYSSPEDKHYYVVTNEEGAIEKVSEFTGGDMNNERAWRDIKRDKTLLSIKRNTG